MEDPESQISSVIRVLCQSSPSAQAAALDRYFLPNASFTHPFVRTGSWDLGNGWNSRWAVKRIYRWYKIMSPAIDVRVESVAVDYGGHRVNGTARVAYATVRQKFCIWFFPFYEADVKLVTRLNLVWDRHWRRYYIQAQEDCYPVTEFLKFLWFGIWRVAWFWQAVSMVVCVILAWIGTPVTWWEEQTKSVQNAPITTQLQRAWGNKFGQVVPEQKSAAQGGRSDAGSASTYSDVSEKTEVEDAIIRFTQ